MATHGNVLITGCSTGIGRATALHLDELGFGVFASVRRESDMDALCAQSSSRLTPILLDVTDPKSLSNATAQICRAVGDAGLTGMVNNAGVAFVSPLESAPLDLVRWLFEVNVLGLLAVTQCFLPLVRQARGRIVNISSMSSLAVCPFHGPYSASKLAVNGFSDALRRELKPLGVQVSVIIPGVIHTAIWRKGGALLARIVRAQGPETNALYGRPYRTVCKWLMHLSQGGTPPEAVARAVAHALTAGRAKHYYLVGRDVQYIWALKTLLPESFSDRIIFRMVGLQPSGMA